MKGARSHRYRVVDVFTEEPLEGNPLAVFPDASGIDDATMQKIARELSLSETTFVLPARRAGCAAFKGSRVYLRELSKEIEASEKPSTSEFLLIVLEEAATVIASSRQIGATTRRSEITNCGRVLPNIHANSAAATGRLNMNPS